MPHAQWSTEIPTPDPIPRSFALDMDDALALRWVSPPTGAAREQAAEQRFEQDDYVMGRLLALQAIALYRENGDEAGEDSALDRLHRAGTEELRSREDPYSLCF